MVVRTVRADVERVRRDNARTHARADARNRTYRHETGHRLVGVLVNRSQPSFALFPRHFLRPLAPAQAAWRAGVEEQ